jgi:hypothetical protein
LFEARTQLRQAASVGRGDSSWTTGGRDTAKIWRYIQQQEAEEQRLDQLESSNQPPQKTFYEECSKGGNPEERR